jgi:hypothetical protein
MSIILEKPQTEPATLSVEEVQQFLYREARFLDDKDWESWLELYAPDAEFWMPSWDDDDQLVTDPQTQISLIWVRAQGRLGGPGLSHQDRAVQRHEHAGAQNVAQHQQCRDLGAGRRRLRAALQLGDVPPDIAALHGYNRRDFDLGHKRLLIDGEHDVFGDGSVICLPTYGHTPGHQSLRLRLDGGEVVLAADSCYFCRTLRERRLPPRAHDREAMLASLDRLAALEAGGARIFYGHDPEFWQTVPQAPAPIS